MQIDQITLTNTANKFNFDIIGVASPETFIEAGNIANDRLNKGYMGDLKWYTSQRINRGIHPEGLLPGVRSIISIAMNYFVPEQHDMNHSTSKIRGKVARYARGRDYHNVMKKLLKQFMQSLEQEINHAFSWKIYVDDGPMLDREVSQRAGIGFFGKNTNILTSQGSWVLLGQVLTNLEIPYSKPLEKSCGSCTTCIPACPTNAIISPYIIDSRKCISYLTIENRGPIPIEYRDAIQDWIFGCDICQEVCPVNTVRSSNTPNEKFEFTPDKAYLDPIEILQMDEETFKNVFQGRAIRRATWHGLQRNACIVLGNIGDESVVPALIDALNSDSDLVRGHAAWALGKISGSKGKQALEIRISIEKDKWVASEINEALKKF